MLDHSCTTLMDWIKDLLGQKKKNYFQFSKQCCIDTARQSIID